MSWVLDLANILGGFLLAVPLLRQIPGAARLDEIAATLDRFRIVVAVACLVAAGYFLLVHITSGPRVFHFEIVGLIVGVLLLRRPSTPGRRAAEPQPSAGNAVTQDPLTLLVCVLGIIAIVVGLQGLVTPN
ncbi:MAG: hypothetical protein U0Q15_19790 [Kineosporiaceae bacterium]